MGGRLEAAGARLGAVQGHLGAAAWQRVRHDAEAEERSRRACLQWEEAAAWLCLEHAAGAARLPSGAEAPQVWAASPLH
jgi:hypothetical protein